MYIKVQSQNLSLPVITSNNSRSLDTVKKKVFHREVTASVGKTLNQNFKTCSMEKNSFNIFS
jgi:hypothetical protein